MTSTLANFSTNPSELQELRPFVNFSFHRRQPDVLEELMQSLPCLLIPIILGGRLLLSKLFFVKLSRELYGMARARRCRFHRACLQTLFQTSVFATFLPVGGDQKKSRDSNKRTFYP
eukprot:scaffold31145_cov61-Skeletonema_dohrnii-CCMP3373.AAC.1